MLVYYSFISCLIILFLNPNHAYSKPGIDVNYQFTVAVPDQSDIGFTGRAFLMDTNQVEPKFRVALSVEAIEVGQEGNSYKYSCSLGVFLGDVKVWDSGHYSRFFVSNKCVVELTGDGDLRLKGPRGRVGWRTGTPGQGVKMLQILNNGNLVLVDGLNQIKWQSFNFPTDVMLLGQRLNVATRLTSFPSNSSSYYSLEIENNKIELYLNSGKSNYSYWEFKPFNDRNITFIKLGAKGLEFFNENGKKIARIPSPVFESLRFLSLSNKTGNLGLYFYSPSNSRFEASFQALNATCDLPSACMPYGICTFSNSCSCIHLKEEEEEEGSGSGCGAGLPGGGSFCPRENIDDFEMIELGDVGSVLKSTPKRVNVSKEDCAELCLEDCQCALASFHLGACSFYRLVGGLKQVDRGSRMSFLVKVPKGVHGVHRRSNVKKWVLILVGVIDGLVILLALGGLGYYLVRKKRRASLSQDGNQVN